MKLFPLLLLAVSVAMAACSRGASSPSDVFVIPHDQIAAVETAAGAGDRGEVRRLIAHYEAAGGSPEVVETWRAKARALGDSEELYYYAARLYTASMTETEPCRKGRMLGDALAAAKRSTSAHAGPSSQELVQDIIQSLARSDGRCT